MGLRFLGNILLIYRSKISTIYKKNIQKRGGIHNGVKDFWRERCGELGRGGKAQALVSFKKYMPPLFRYFKVNIYPFPLPHFASLFFAYLWSFYWPNYIFTLPRYFSFRLPHLNINTGPPSDELDRIFNESRIFYFSVTETDTTTSGLRWIFHMHSEFSRPAMCNNAIMIISFQM